MWAETMPFCRSITTSADLGSIVVSAMVVSPVGSGVRVGEGCGALGRPPRNSEAIAARRARDGAEGEHDDQAGVEGPEIRLGKNSRPVRVCCCAAVRWVRAPLGWSRCWIGLTPSWAANRDATGGRLPTWAAMWAGDALLAQCRW